MARYGSRFRRSFSRAGSGLKRKVTAARRTAAKHRNKAKTLTTVLMAAGAYLAYDKFIKKS